MRMMTNVKVGKALLVKEMIEIVAIATTTERRGGSDDDDSSSSNNKGDYHLPEHCHLLASVLRTLLPIDLVCEICYDMDLFP